MKHIEELSRKEFAGVIQRLSDFYISEKFDGSELLVGLDEIGFYTSRETMGGKRIYNVNDYPIKFSTTYQRSAHQALKQLLPELTNHNFKIGDQFEVEVLYSALPNVINYDIQANYIVFLRTTAGTFDIHQLVDITDSIIVEDIIIPRSTNGKDIFTIQRNDEWKFKVVSSINVNFEILNIPDTDDRQVIKKYLLDLLIKGRKSELGGIEIEGIVFYNPETNEQYKLVDKDTFLTKKDHIWLERYFLSTSMTGRINLMGYILGHMARSLNNPKLGTTQAKKILRSLGFSKDEVVEKLSENVEFDIIKASWMPIFYSALVIFDIYLKDYLKNLRYKNDHIIVHERTVEAFADIYNTILKMQEAVISASTIEELIEIFVGKQLNDIFIKA